MLTPDALDAFAQDYYLNNAVATIDLEERAQLLSVPRLVEAIGDRSPVLEMGLGTGLITAALLDHGVTPDLLEGSPVLCDEARRRHPEVKVHEGLFEAWTPKCGYGAVLALHVLEHVDDPVELLDHMHSWLLDGGALIAVVPNAESLHRRIAVEMGLHDHLDDLSESDHLVGHQRVYDLDRLTADLDAAGYDVDFDFGYLLKTVPNAMMLDYPSDMVTALNTISTKIDSRDLANIGVRAIPRSRSRRSSTAAPTLANRDRTTTEASVLTAIVLADGNRDAAAMSAASVAAVADEVLVLDRAEVDWTSQEVTTAVLSSIVDDWVVVLAAGERLRVTDPQVLRGHLQETTQEALAVHAGLGGEVRIHRTAPTALAAIGTPSDDVVRCASVAPSGTELGSDPAVSVIVPTFNRPRLLRRCLQGLCVQTTENFEVIVVNDGSSDATLDRLIDGFRLDITLITQPHNGGAATAANAGLAVSRGRYAHFQADDDTIHPHHIQLLHETIAASHDDGKPAGIAFGPAWMIEEAEDGRETDRTVIFREGHSRERLLSQNFIVGGSAMFDAALAKEIGGMDTDYEVLEDWDFWLRMSAHAELVYVDTPTAEYRMRPGTGNVTTQARPRFYTNLLRLYREHPCEPGSEVDQERLRQQEAQADSHQDAYAWDRTIAIIGDGNLANLIETIQTALVTAGSAGTQLIVHEVRTPDAERALFDLARDATVCLHDTLDEGLCRRRVERQAGGRRVDVLRSWDNVGPIDI